MAKELAALGGTDYTSTANLGPSGTLNTAAAAFNTMTPQQLALSYLTVFKNNAVAAGATIASDIDDIAAAIKCLDNFDEKVLEQMELLLTCKLGVHKTYPQ